MSETRQAGPTDCAWCLQPLSEGGEYAAIVELARAHVMACPRAPWRAVLEQVVSETRAALSAAEKERASGAGVVRNGITALREIAKIETDPGKKRALQILALGFVVLADTMGEDRSVLEASAASEAQPPPAPPGASSTQEGD